MTSPRQNQLNRCGLLQTARSTVIALSMTILSPALAVAEERPAAANPDKAAEKAEDHASRMMTPEEQKRFELIREENQEGPGKSPGEKTEGEPTESQRQDIPASRPMTPEEEKQSGLTERFRREEEERKKEVALHLPSFAKLQPMLAMIKDDQEPSMFEGLPHQVFYPQQHASELKTRETLTHHGFSFYKTPIKLAAEDVRKLNALMKHPDSFSPYMAINGPGGFQPDFSLVWENNGKPIEVQVCFGNGGEIKAFHDNVLVHCQMAGIKALLKPMLGKYHRQLPEPKE